MFHINRNHLPLIHSGGVSHCSHPLEYLLGKLLIYFLYVIINRLYLLLNINMTSLGSVAIPAGGDAGGKSQSGFLVSYYRTHGGGLVVNMLGS